MNDAGANWQLVVYGRAMRGFAHEGAVATPGVASEGHATGCQYQQEVRLPGFSAPRTAATLTA